MNRSDHKEEALQQFQGDTMSFQTGFLFFASGLVCWRSLWLQVKGQFTGGVGPVLTALFMILNVSKSIFMSELLLLPVILPLFDQCVFSRCQSGLQWWPLCHTWREGGQCEPKDPDDWHRHRPVHLRRCPMVKREKKNHWEETMGSLWPPLNVNSSDFITRSYWRDRGKASVQKDPHVDLWGKVKWKRLLLCQRLAWMLVEEKEAWYLIYSALWRTCLMFSVLRKSLGGSFSCPLSGLNSFVFAKAGTAFCPSSCQTLALEVLGGWRLALSLLSTSASTPPLSKAKVALSSSFSSKGQKSSCGCDPEQHEWSRRQDSVCKHECLSALQCLYFSCLGVVTLRSLIGKLKKMQTNPV